VQRLRPPLLTLSEPRCPVLPSNSALRARAPMVRYPPWVSGDGHHCKPSALDAYLQERRWSNKARHKPGARVATNAFYPPPYRRPIAGRTRQVGQWIWTSLARSTRQAIRLQVLRHYFAVEQWCAASRFEPNRTPRNLAWLSTIAGDGPRIQYEPLGLHPREEQFSPCHRQWHCQHAAED